MNLNGWKRGLFWVGILAIGATPLRATPEEIGAFQVWERSAPFVVLAVGTLLFGASIWLIRRFRRWLQLWITRKFAQGARRIESDELRRLGLRQLIPFVRDILQALAVVGQVVVTAVWVIFVLELFDLTRPWGDVVRGEIISQLQELGISAVHAVPALAIVFFVFLFTRFVHRLMNGFFDLVREGGLNTETFDTATAEMTRRLLQVVLWVSAIIIAYPYLPGSESPAFRGVSILAGLMFSLGSANLVSQLTNGLILTYTRAVRVGDVIETGPHEGVVERLGFFTTSLRTPRQELISLPNSQLANGLVNYSRPTDGETVRFTTEVGIGYDAPWRQVHELLIGATHEVKAIRPVPEPEVRQKALNDFTVQYVLHFSLRDPAQRPLARAQLHAAIQDAFHGAGIQIMSPHYVADPGMPKIPPTEVEIAVEPEVPPT